MGEDKVRPLTEREERFVHYYIETGNAEQSAIKAGYSPNTARGHSHKLLQNVSIRAELEKYKEKFLSERIASAEEILGLMTDIARGELKSAAIIGPGMVTEEMKPTTSERLTALTTLGKRYGLWTEKRDKKSKELKIKKDEIVIDKLTNGEGTTNESEVAKMLKTMAENMVKEESGE